MMAMIHRYVSEKMQRSRDYMHALEEERKKIEVFQRELPLCFELVTQAIETCKLRHNQSENLEQTSNVPVLEDFIITTKKASSESQEQDYCINLNKDEGCSSLLDREKDNNNPCNKSDWLRSVQLWNQTDPDPADQLEEDVNAPPYKENLKNIEKIIDPETLNHTPASTSSTSSGVKNKCNDNKKEGKEGKSPRKSRRCWSPELHKRFVQALKQLGGSHAATPKQIRELMKVDGLTNDEVKSHLQKYRLHNRRPSPNNNTSAAPQAPQFVVVGGIWVPPEYSIVRNKTTEESFDSGIIASLAPPSQESDSLPSPKRKTDHRHNIRGCGHNKDRSKLTSPSHHTTTKC